MTGIDDLGTGYVLPRPGTSRLRKGTKCGCCESSKTGPAAGGGEPVAVREPRSYR
jgi:hypothetical protein